LHALTLSSPYAKLQSLPLDAVCVTDGFWAKRQLTNRRISLLMGYKKLEQAGNFHNFRLAAGLNQGNYRGLLFMDSDIYKWLEAVAYEIAKDRNVELENLAEQTIKLIAAAQEPDGYLNSYYQVAFPGQRWTNLDHGHEMYCAGHLIQAAIAYHRATDRDELLSVACRFADHLVDTFGEGCRDEICGHPEIEIALVELFRETGQTKFLNLATTFINRRGHRKLAGYGPYGPEYHQDHVPVRDANQVEGHAVRQLYLNSGVADSYMETGDLTLLSALNRLWRDMITSKMYITGGYGARFDGESFGEAYELPNTRNYCETCAAIAAMMWNWRMLLATGQAGFADALERSLYNGFLSGVSLDGTQYFYTNALLSQTGTERQDWFTCACCPPNVMRQMSVVGHYIATQNAEGIQIHQFISSKITFDRLNDSSISLKLETDYPWHGDIKLVVEQSNNSTWTLALRVPSWSVNPVIEINNQITEVPLIPGTYVNITRSWNPNDEVILRIPIRPRFTQAHPRVDALQGSLAIERGPLVYCIEHIDQPEINNLLDVRVNHRNQLQDVWREDSLNGIMTVLTQGVVIDTSKWGEQLYRPLDEEILKFSPVSLTAIPYYAWANRERGAMRVWLPLVKSD